MQALAYLVVVVIGLIVLWPLLLGVAVFAVAAVVENPAETVVLAAAGFAIAWLRERLD